MKTLFIGALIPILQMENKGKRGLPKKVNMDLQSRYFYSSVLSDGHDDSEAVWTRTVCLWQWIHGADLSSHAIRRSPFLEAD